MKIKKDTLAGGVLAIQKKDHSSIKPMSYHVTNWMTALLRKPQVLAILGIQKSHLHDQIKKGLLPPPVSIGARSVAWPDYEIEELTRALIGELPEDEIKELVASMVEKRTFKKVG